MTRDSVFLALKNKICYTGIQATEIFPELFLNQHSFLFVRFRVSKSKTLSLISIYSLAALSSMLLAYAEIAFLPQCLTPFIVIVAFVFVERKKSFSLSTLWANLLGVASILLAAQELFFGSIEGRLLSGAHLLVYLMWIVLLQKKETQHYWWIITLSLLQVAVGSVLTNDGSYGLFLLLFLFSSIWTLSLFWVQQVQENFSFQENQPLSAQSSFTIERNETSEQNKVSPSSKLAQRKSFAKSGICFQPGETWLTKRFIFGVFNNILGAAFISAFFFVLIPRLWIGSGRIAEAQANAIAALGTLTGFSDKVQLGDIGTILESREKVLEVNMFHEETGEAIDVEKYTSQLGYEEPYFRGTVLEVYKEGGWELSSRILSHESEFSSHWEKQGRFKGQFLKNEVRQEYQLEPIGTEKLFAVLPFSSGWTKDANISSSRIDILSHITRRYLVLEEGNENTNHRQLEYTIYSPAQIEEKHRRYLPVIDESPLLWNDYTVYTALPQKDVPGLIALAKDVASRGQSTTDQLVITKRLESFLRETGGYTYTLKMSRKDKTIDPIEDFLLNRKSGHCEYYATALALMLRAVGIPSRLVSGFKGGEKNLFTGAFEVQQRHAHAWVEAYVNGRWILLDATPATRAESVKNQGSSFSSWANFKEMMKSFWSENVVSMNYSKQTNSVYKPIQKSITEWWSSFSKGEIDSQSLFAGIKDFFLSPKKWISATGGIVSFALMLFLLVLYFIVRRVVPLLLRLLKKIQQQKNSIPPIKVDFYERFSKLCASRGFTRSQSETQQEFATQAVQHFNADLAAIGSPAFPQELVTSFYQIRFGGDEIQEPQRNLINQLLTQLEQQFKKN